jgi:conjugal transfer pilus assembly protein TraW
MVKKSLKNKHNRLSYFCVLLLLAFNIFAKDLGVVGHIFEIKEQDIAEIIALKLQRLNETGELALHQEKILRRALEQVKNPTPVGLPNAIETRTFFYDPSITLKTDIRNHQNTLIYAKGTRINPFSYVTLHKQWLFFNGDNAEHLAWAKAQYKTGDKLILVRGSAVDLMKEWQVPIYFDQNGFLTKKIGIRYIPAQVVQEEKGQRLMITEIPLLDKQP